MLKVTAMRWWLARGFDKLGWLGTAGLALLLLALLGWRFVLAPLQAQIMQMPANPTAKLAPKTNNQAEDLAQFAAQFPQIDARNAVIQDIAAKASALGIDLGRVNYQNQENLGQENLGADAYFAISQYHMQFSTQAEYGAIFQLLSQVLNAHPHVALQELSLHRVQSNRDKTEARIHLIMYFNPHLQTPNADAYDHF